MLAKDPDKAPRAVGLRMRHWLRDPDFNGVRGTDALGRAPGARARAVARAVGRRRHSRRRLGGGTPEPRKAMPGAASKND